MIGRGANLRAARLLSAVAVALTSTSAVAQAPASTNATPPPVTSGELDPNAPLAPMPDLGVAWPDLKAADEPPSTAIPSAIAGNPQQPQATPVTSGGNIRYTLAVEGLTAIGNAPALLADFRKQSTLDQERKHPANAAQIGRRAAADAELLEELLRSRGYYDASVEPRTESAGNQLRVILTADPGQQYRFASVNLPGLDAAGPEAARLRKAFAVKAGDPVIAADVIAGGIALTQALGEQGFAQATLGEQDVEVNHQTHLATLTLPVKPGPVARFGTIRVSGRPPFSARHLAVMARFRPGDRFERSKVDDLRRALIQTTLVANADVRVVPVAGGRTVDLDVHLEPAPSHTIAGEIGYGTGQGASVEASWTDRNFFNPEGAVTVRGIAGTSEQLLGLEFRRSNFRRRDQTFDAQLTASHQKFDAYTAKTVLLSANIERQSNFIWQKKWTYSFGGEWLATDEYGVFDATGVKDTRTFLIAAAPATLGYDGSDSLLDPSRGFRLSGRLSPEVSYRGGARLYARAQIDASAYRPVADRVVLAGRVRFGTIVGASAFDLTPSRRFYAGGGGSVRGYGYQQLGPKDSSGDPIGGRGLAEFGLEARVRLKSFGGNLGIVPFFDGGSLTYKAIPGVGTWRFAAGLGVRYYSSFGPIRVDVGVPLNRQQGDGPFAVAVSLGQAF